MTQSIPNPVVLAGATGYIGRAVARTLTARGYPVLALVRCHSEAAGIDELAGCELREVEVTDAAALSGVLRGLTGGAFISCLASRSGVAEDAWRVDYQANVHLLAQAQHAEASRFVLLSALCVQKPRLAFQEAKLAFEHLLMESGISYSVVRPTAFFKSLSGQLGRVRDGKPFLVFGGGTETACKPISERDLANYLVDCLERRDLTDRVLPIGGPGPALTPRDQGHLLFELLDRPPRFRSVPVGLFKVAGAVLNVLGKLLPRMAAKAELARIGHYYATESMLVWDKTTQQYSADATPETGEDTLREHYQQIIHHGLKGHELGAHKVFSGGD
ncbi:MAG: NAD(P)H-binding protein [Pseudomonadota bacterium]